MKLIPINDANVFEEAVNILSKGGSIVYPTDTVYGLGVNPFDDFAVRRLFRIKKRPAEKPVPLIIKSIAMAKKLAYITTEKEKVLRKFWPGAVSVVLCKKGIISELVSAGSDTVSLRIPSNDFCVNLVKEFNSPITSTSANVSGEEAMTDPEIIKKRFSREPYKPDLIISAGILETHQPSTVIDFTKDKPRVIRVGPIKSKDLVGILVPR